MKKTYLLIIIITIIIILILLYARYIGTNGLITKEYKVINKNLPDSFDGLKVVHFTDLHYGRTTDDDEVSYLVKNINDLNPDIIFFTGDLIDRHTKLTDKQEKFLKQALSGLNAKIGKYYIRGNHDTYFKSYFEIMDEANFINVNNNYEIIYSSNQDKLFIGGIETEVEGNPDYSLIEEHLNNEENNYSYTILLLHTPDYFDKIKSFNFDLILAGHSHQGQVRLPFLGSVYNAVGSKKYNEAYYKIKDTDFYISGGIGTSTLSFRWFNRPSYNFYRITKK